MELQGQLWADFCGGHCPNHMCLLNISYIPNHTEGDGHIPGQSQQMEETLESLGLFRFVNTIRPSLQGELVHAQSSHIGSGRTSVFIQCPPKTLFLYLLLIPATLGQLPSPGSPAAQGLRELPDEGGVGRLHVVPAQGESSLDPGEEAKATVQAMPQAV